jgi:Beta-propeller repeat
MLRLQLFMSVYCCLFLCLSSPQADELTPAWEVVLGDEMAEDPQCLVVDHVGNTIIGGSYRGGINFGDGELINSGGKDIFLAKYNSEGGHVWSQRFGNSDDQEIRAIDVDTYGNIYITGLFQGTLSFGGGNLVSAGGYDAFLVKFTSVGNHVWSYSFGDVNTQAGQGLSTGETGKLYLIGSFSDTINLGGETLVSAGGYDIYFAQFGTSLGTHQRSFSFGNSEADYGRSINANVLGEVVFTGGCSGTVDFGGGPLSSVDESDLFIAKYSSQGQHLWSGIFGGLGQDYGDCIKFHQSDRSFTLCGHFENSINLGHATHHCAGQYDGCLAKFDHNSNLVWDRYFSSSEEVVPWALDIDALGRIGCTGYFESTGQFGGMPMISSGGRDLFFTVFTAAGVFERSQRAGDAEDQLGRGIGFGSDGDIRLSAMFMGSLDLGSVPVTSAGDFDIYLASLTEASSAVDEAVDQLPTSGLAGRLTISPNPGRGDRTISYELFRPGPIALTIHDSEGRLLERLVERVAPAGVYRFSYTPRSESGGVLFARLRIGEQILTRQILHVQ